MGFSVGGVGDLVMAVIRMTVNWVVMCQEMKRIMKNVVSCDCIIAFRRYN